MISFHYSELLIRDPKSKYTAPLPTRLAHSPFATSGVLMFITSIIAISIINFCKAPVLLILKNVYISMILYSSIGLLIFLLPLLGLYANISRHESINLVRRHSIYIDENNYDDDN